MVARGEGFAEPLENDSNDSVAPTRRVGRKSVTIEFVPGVSLLAIVGRRSAAAKTGQWGIRYGTQSERLRDS
jgi:hypothetical protein